MVGCSKCGQCCNKIIIELSVEPTQIEKEWWLTRDCVVNGKYISLPIKCPFLSPLNLCSIYETRPLLCRVYPTKLNKERLRQFNIKCEA